MTKILTAASIIDSKINSLSQQVTDLKLAGLVPNLTVVLVGENPASLSYIKNKKKFCEKIGAHFHLITLDEKIKKDEFLEKIHQINDNPNVTGCFVQLPVPKHLQEIDITQLINPKKDVDGFHLDSVNRLYRNDLNGLISCTPKGIITLLKENNIEIEGADITIIGRSHIVGKPLSLLLQALNATVTVCHSKTKDMKKHTRSADIIIAAVGKAEFLDKTYLNADKQQIVIDVGINRKNGKLVGDVNFTEAKEVAQFITPVPGGVGPMTVFSLMENLIQATRNILEE